MNWTGNQPSYHAPPPHLLETFQSTSYFGRQIDHTKQCRPLLESSLSLRSSLIRVTMSSLIWVTKNSLIWVTRSSLIWVTRSSLIWVTRTSLIWVYTIAILSTSLSISLQYMSHIARKHIFRVRHKPGCTATEDG